MMYTTPEGFKRYLGDSGTPDISYRLAKDDEYAALLRHVEKLEVLNAAPESIITIQREQAYIISNDSGDIIIAANAAAVQFGEPDNLPYSSEILPPGVKEITLAPVIASIYEHEGIPIVQGSTQIVSSKWGVERVPEPIRASTATAKDWNFVDSYLDPNSNDNLFADAGTVIRNTVREQIQERNNKITAPNHNYKLLPDIEDVIESRGISMFEREVIQNEINKDSTDTKTNKVFVGNIFKINDFKGCIALGYAHIANSNLAMPVGYQLIHNSVEGRLNIRALSKDDYQDLKIDPDFFNKQLSLDKDMISLISPSGFTKLRAQKNEERINRLTNDNMSRAGFLENLVSRLGDKQGRYIIQQPGFADYDQVCFYANENCDILRDDKPFAAEVINNTLGGSYILKDTKTKERFFIGSVLVHDKAADTIIKAPLITHVPDDVKDVPNPNKAFKELGLSKEGMPLQVLTNASSTDVSEKKLYHATFRVDPGTGEPSYVIDRLKPVFEGESIPKLRTYRDDGEIEGWIHSSSIKQAVDIKNQKNITHIKSELAIQDINPSLKPDSDGGARKFIRWQVLMQDTRKALLDEVRQFSSAPASTITKEISRQHQENKRLLALSIISPEAFSELAGHDGNMRPLEPSAINSLLDIKEPGEFMGLDTITGAGVVSRSRAEDIENSQIIRSNDMVLSSITVKNHTSDPEHTNLYVVQEAAAQGDNHYYLQLLAERVDSKGNVLVTGEKALEAIGIDKNSVVPSLSASSILPADAKRRLQDRFVAQITPSELRKKMNTKQIQQQAQQASVDSSLIAVAADTHVSTDVRVPVMSPDIKPHLPNTSHIDKMKTEAYNGASKVFVRSLNSDEVECINQVLDNRGGWSDSPAVITGAALIKKQCAKDGQSDTLVYREKRGDEIVSNTLSVDSIFGLLSDSPEQKRAQVLLDELNLRTETPACSVNGDFAQGMDIMTTALNASKQGVSEEVVIASLKTFAAGYINSRYEKERAEIGFRDQSTANDVQVKLDQLDKMQQRQSVLDVAAKNDTPYYSRSSVKRP